MNASKLVSECAASMPDRLGFWSPVRGEMATFGELEALSGIAAHNLRRHGVTPGKGVVVALDHGASLRLVAAYLATIRCGAFAILVGGVPAEDVLTVLVAAGDEVSHAVIEDGQDGSPWTTLDLVCLPISGVVFESGDKIAAVDRAAGDPVDVVFTSGSTGPPRAWRSTHGLLRAMVAAARGGDPVSSAFPPLPADEDPWLNGFRLDTSQGQVLFWSALALGAATVSAVEIGDIERALRETKPGCVYLSPLQTRLLGNRTTEAFDFVTSFSSASAPAHQDVWETASRLFPQARRCNEYGATQSGLACTVLDVDEGPPDSVGRGYLATEVRIEPLAAPTSSPDERVGRVAMRYPGVAAPVPWPLDSGVAANSDDWIETGDAGWLDDAGNLYLVGRVDDIILRGGRLVSLDGVTERIRQSCDVLDAVVIATDDAYLGADILAAVVLPDDTTLDDVLACMRTSLLPHELPTFVRQVASVPRTRSGKVDRPATRELLIRMSGQGTT